MKLFEFWKAKTYGCHQLFTQRRKVDDFFTSIYGDKQTHRQYNQRYTLCFTFTKNWKVECIWVRLYFMAYLLHIPFILKPWTWLRLFQLRARVCTSNGSEDQGVLSALECIEHSTVVPESIEIWFILSSTTSKILDYRHTIIGRRIIVSPCDNRTSWEELVDISRVLVL